MKVSNSSIFNNKKTGIIMSVVSLILIVCLLVVATYSWVEAGNEGEVDSSNNLSFDVTPDLDISGDNVTDGKITIPNFELREVSSVDGRNVYVPDDSFYENTAGDGTKTDELRFREANPADVYDGDENNKPSNMRYVAFSFYISSASGEETPVYLSSDSSITGTGAQYVRMSIDTHDGNAPKVFSSSASVGYPVYTDAVSSIKSSGEYKDLSSQKAEAFATYAYLGEANPLFILKANEKKRVTVTLWLEGASGDFPDTDEETIVGKKISAHINLKTTKDYTNTIKVVDRTLDNWAYNNNSYLFVYDADSNNISYKMDYDGSSNTWTAKIPQNVRNVYFRRWNPEDASVKWNSWGSKTYPLTVPGAENLFNNGNEGQKAQGITRIYNILGTDEIEGNDNYDKFEAGLWGDIPDDAFDEVHFFDQSSSSASDTKGYFNWDVSIIPAVNMSVTYDYDGTEVTTNLRYRLFREYVSSRLFHNTQFVGADRYTIKSVKYVDYKKFDYRLADADDEAGAIKNVEIGNMEIDAATGYCSDNKRFFAYTGNSTGYWGTCMNYLSNKGIYSKDTSNGVRYAICYKNSSSAEIWKSMCRWNDTYTKGTSKKFPADDTKEWVYACVNPGYDKAIYCRMNGATTSNSWTNRWNQSGDNTSAQSLCDCTITGWGDNPYFTHEAFSNWLNMPGR